MDSKDDAFDIKEESDEYEDGDQLAMFDEVANVLEQGKKSSEIENLFNIVDYPFLTEYYEYDGNAEEFLEEYFDYENFDSPYDYKDVFSNYGFGEFMSNIKENFFSTLDDYGFTNRLTLDDRGLLYVERAMTIPRFKDTTFKNELDGQENNDFYSHIQRYSGIGNCWTWCKGASEAYCGSYYGGNSSIVVLKGYVNPRDVDWAETVYRNAYGLNYEREIYISKGNVEIDRIELVGGQYQGQQAAGKNLLAKPIVVPV